MWVRTGFRHKQLFVSLWIFSHIVDVACRSNGGQVSWLPVLSRVTSCSGTMTPRTSPSTWRSRPTWSRPRRTRPETRLWRSSPTWPVSRRLTPRRWRWAGQTGHMTLTPPKGPAWLTAAVSPQEEANKIKKEASDLDKLIDKTEKEYEELRDDLRPKELEVRKLLEQGRSEQQVGSEPGSEPGRLLSLQPARINSSSSSSRVLTDRWPAAGPSRRRQGRGWGGGQEGPVHLQGGREHPGRPPRYRTAPGSCVQNLRVPGPVL